MFGSWKGVVLMCVCLGLLGALAAMKVDGAAVAAIAAVTTLVAWLTRSPSKDDPPPGAHLVPFVAVASILSGFLSACSDPKAVSPPCRSLDLSVPECGALYQEQLLECSATSTTLAQSQQCEDEVRARFARPRRDGGAS